MHILTKFLITVGAVALTIKIVPGVALQGGFINLFLVALVWSIISGVIRPVLTLVTLPITIITFGLFSLFLNTFLFYAIHWIVPEFTISGFWSALFGSIILSIISWLISKAFE